MRKKFGSSDTCAAAGSSSAPGRTSVPAPARLIFNMRRRVGVMVPSPVQQEIRVHGNGERHGVDCFGRGATGVACKKELPPRRVLALRGIVSHHAEPELLQHGVRSGFLGGPPAKGSQCPEESLVE